MEYWRARTTQEHQEENAAIRWIKQDAIPWGYHNVDKRRRVGMALTEYPAWSACRLAKLCGVSVSLVAKVRKERNARPTLWARLEIVDI